jgi:hypothetical protein
MKLIKSYPLSLLALLISTLAFSQSPLNEKKLDRRIDNLGYWNWAAEKGLTKPNPVVPVEPAIYKGSKIYAITTTREDSPDVPLITGATSQSENSISIDPNDNDKALNSNNSTGTPSYNITFYGANDLYTSDFGATWGGQLEGAGGYNSGDPIALIDRNGRWFVGYITGGYGQGVSISDDGGATWTMKTISGLIGGENMLDKEHLWVDNSPSSPYVDNVYAAWTAFGGQNDSQVEFSYSTDHGETWSTGVNVSSAMGGAFCHGVNICTGPNGEVYAVFAVYSGGGLTEKAIGLARSLDGGQTFEAAVKIIDNINGIRESGTSKNMRVNSFPSSTCDISAGPYRGNIYVVWPNKGVPGINTGSDIDVYMIRSEDGGTSWTAPVKVNQDPSGQGKQHYSSWITADPTTGTLSTIFYDDRNVTATQCEVFCANSYDAGDTWEDFLVSDVSFTPSPIPGLANGYFGDYLGISARHGHVYPVWTDNRTGTALTYTSPYTTSTMAAPTDLVADLNQETGAVALSWHHESSPTFDHYNIYRNLILLGTSTWPIFLDTLPDYGIYRYMVTAYYTIEGESGPAIADIQWGSAQINLDPPAVVESLQPGETSTRFLTISNPGELDLNYTAEFSLPPAYVPDLSYCSGTGGCGEFIYRVTLGSIDTVSGCGGYQDFTNLSTTMVAGQPYLLTVINGLNIYPQDVCGVWIDWNQNNNFLDDQPVTVSGTPGVGPYTATIIPPTNAVNGTTRMRIRITRGGTLSPCGLSQYGEVEDYSVTILSWVTGEPLTGQIAPGESGQITLQFNAGSLDLGTYMANLNFTTNDLNNPTITVPITLNVQNIPPLALTVTADKDSICFGGSTHLYATATGGFGNYTYSWTSDPAGFTSTEQNPIVEPAVTTIYTVEVSDGTNTLQENKAISVIPLPVVNLGPDVSVCSGGSVVFDAGAGFAFYNWNNGQTSQTITVSQSGIYWVDVANDFGCTTRDSVQLTVNPLPVVNLGANFHFCEGTSAMIDASPGFAEYLWNTGATTQTITVTQPGDYWVEVINQFGCSDNDTIQLFMDPLPLSTEITSGPTIVNTFENTTSDFSASQAANATSYAWTIMPENAGSLSPNGLNAQVTWADGFTGNAELTIKALNDCGQGPVSPAFSVTVYSSQGIGEGNEKLNLEVYPNPSEGTFTLSLVNGKDRTIQIRISNANGKAVFSREQVLPAGAQSLKVNLSTQPDGVYSLIIQGDHGVISRKIVLKK